MNRIDALLACKKSKSTANLVSIPDETTNAFVQSLVSWRSWIGLGKINGEWVWPDGTRATYLPWATKYGNPDGDGPFVEIWADSYGPGKWNDLAAFHKREAVCQYDFTEGTLLSSLIREHAYLRQGWHGFIHLDFIHPDLSR